MKIEKLYTWIEEHGSFSAARSSGPGGQHVNKANTKVTLRLHLSTAPLSAEELERIRYILGNRITVNDQLLIHASETRSQKQNREAAVNRAVSLITSAAERPKKRKKTKPGKAVKEKRLEHKKKRGEKKRLRKDPEI